MFLADTNIFLEILLKRDKKERCKKFLDDNIINLSMTDFSLHSVGVILFRYGKVDVFLKFAEDVALNVKLLSLPIESYREVVSASKSFNLDFDDAYHYAIAKHYGLKIVTMDEDYKRMKDIEVSFL